MKLKEKIWRWWTRKPLPKKRHSLAAWDAFVRQAPLWQVEEVFEKSLTNDIVFNDSILRLFRRRMSKFEWPKVSKMFLLLNRKKVLSFSNNESLMSAVARKFDDKKPKYVVDKNRKICGIAISQNCVIDKVLNYPFGLWGARQEEYAFLNSEDIENLCFCIDEVNEMLRRFNLPQIKEKYWVKGCCVFNARQAIQKKKFDEAMFSDDDEAGCLLSKI